MNERMRLAFAMKCKKQIINDSTYALFCRSVYFNLKGQIKPKADWRAIDSPKK